MPFTIPNQPGPISPIQSRVFQTDWEILAAALDLHGVYFGCNVTAQATPNNTVALASGAIIVNGVMNTTAAGNLTMTAADATNPRIDLVYFSTSAGIRAYLAGTASPNPAPPALPADSVALAYVFVPAGLTAITNAHITDKRVLIPSYVWSQTAIPAAITNVTADTAFANTHTLPGNSFFVGQVIRVSARGLFTTAATPGTTIFRVKFGTIVLALTATTTMIASITNGIWQLEGEIYISAVGSGTTAQAEFLGMVTIQNVAGATGTLAIPIRAATPTAPVGFNSTIDVPLTITVHPSVTTQSWTMRQFVVRNQS